MPVREFSKSASRLQSVSDWTLPGYKKFRGRSTYAAAQTSPQLVEQARSVRGDRHRPPGAVTVLLLRWGLRRSARSCPGSRSTRLASTATVRIVSEPWIDDCARAKGDADPVSRRQRPKTAPLAPSSLF